MRVVGGRVKGHHLRMPRGTETRPTSAKVREAIFGMLTGTFEDSPVVDLFAGTGALGIEALSRGASHASFVERRGPACQVIRANLEHTHLLDMSRILCMPVERALGLLVDPVALVLLDPPYAHTDLHRIMGMIGGARVLGDDTTVVFEHSPRFSVAECYGRLALQRQKVYGDTAVSLYVVQEDENE